MSASLGAARRGKPKIRPPRQKPGIDLNETWNKVAHALREIQLHHASEVSYEENYRYAYNMVLYKHGDRLYNGCKTLIKEHLEALAEERIVPAFPRGSSVADGTRFAGAEAVERAMEGERFLKAVKNVWDDHNSSMRLFSKIVRYMDKVNSLAGQVPEIIETGLTLFLGYIVRSPTHPIHQHFISTLLSQILLERNGETIQRSSVRECVDILLRLHAPGTEEGRTVYSTDFEPVFLSRSAEYYQAEAAEMLEKGDAAAYLRNVERRFAEENDRCAHYLSNSTHPALHEMMVAHLLVPHLKTILGMPGSGLVSMLDSDRTADLRRMYVIFRQVPNDQGRLELRLALRTDIEDRGREINSGSNSSPTDAGPSQDGDAARMDVDAEADPKGKAKVKPATVPTASPALSSALRWVQDVLALKDKFDRILATAFDGDKSVQASINEAFQSFINANPRSPEYLSLYIDENLKKGAKTRSDDEVESALEKTLILFRYLTDKDRFERYYKNHLARRLLYARSVSDDAEKGMVAKLKVEMGFQFTQKLEGMFSDMRLSADSANTFRNYLNRHGALPFELSVNVLTASYWPPPIAASSPVSFSNALTPATSTFHKYYDSRHSGRRLTWQGNLGTADIKVRFRARSHDLNVSTQAMVVLLLFEDVQEGQTLGYEELRSATGMLDTDLQRTLQSLACGKYRILTKMPKGRDVNPTDKFAFNDGFTCPLARIKIMQVASKVETGKEREETQEQVDEERKHMIEACIVRIMKSKKTMPHNDLISEVAHQLSTRFVPSMSMIKKRIEGLIDREYLERTNEIGVYHYLA